MADPRDDEIKGRTHVISTQMADGFVPPSTSLDPAAPVVADADVRLVASALAAEDVNWGYDCGFWVTDTEIDRETEAMARAVLSALAAVGRLAPGPPLADRPGTTVHGNDTARWNVGGKWVEKHV